MQAAWEKVKAGSIPQIGYYDNENMRKFLALCWHLRDTTGVFDCPVAAAELLGVSKMTVSRWLQILRADEIISIVKQHTGTKAKRHRFGDDCCYVVKESGAEQSA